MLLAEKNFDDSHWFKLFLALFDNFTRVLELTELGMLHNEWWQAHYFDHAHVVSVDHATVSLDELDTSNLLISALNGLVLEFFVTFTGGSLENPNSAVVSTHNDLPKVVVERNAGNVEVADFEGAKKVTVS
jgi:hypothetical protein